MKKILILSIAAFLVFAFTQQASASLAQFYAVDNLGTSGGDNLVTLETTSYNPGYTLQYKEGSGSWQNVTTLFYQSIFQKSYFTVDTSETTDFRELVQLRLLNNSNSSTITNATMLFVGQYFNSNLYNHVELVFGSNTSFLFAAATPGDTDKVSPVPLPGAVLLLGTGLIGLVGVRRKFRD